MFNIFEKCLKHSRKTFETSAKDVLNIFERSLKHSRKSFETSAKDVSNIVERRLKHSRKEFEYILERCLEETSPTYGVPGPCHEMGIFFQNKKCDKSMM